MWRRFEYLTAAPDVSVLQLPTWQQRPLTSVATQILLTPATGQLGPRCSRSRPLASPHSSGFRQSSRLGADVCALPGTVTNSQVTVTHQVTSSFYILVEVAPTRTNPSPSTRNKNTRCP